MHKVAEELLAMARELLAMEFPTQDAMDKYLKEHPDADRSNHKVVETKKPEKKKTESVSQGDVENAFRDHLSRTDRMVTKESMKSVIKGQFKGLTDTGFDKVWNSLVEDEYLVPVEGGSVKDSYKWAM